MEISGRKIEIYPSAAPDRPVIYLNTFGEEGREVCNKLISDNCCDHTLVLISISDWDHDMSPWTIPPISQNAAPCTGGADEYLKILTEDIIPSAEKIISGKALWRGLAGYSLAGLFAVYSLYRTDIFSRIASVSGSLWFPDFKEYVTSGEMKKQPLHMYFSLGDKECKTRNPYLKSVEENTVQIAEYCRDKGIDTYFKLNQGNHFKDAAARTAAGIEWILGR